MFSSLPDYRRFAHTALQRLNNAPERKPSNRFCGMLLNLVLLAGLWGLPLYARWMILTERDSTKSLAEAIIGKWRCSETSYLEFTPDHHLRLFRNDSIIESADYQLVGHVLQVFRFKLQPGDQELEINQQCYRFSIRGDRLNVTSADIGFTPVISIDRPRDRSGGSHMRQVLPRWHGAILHFQRAGDN